MSAGVWGGGGIKLEASPSQNINKRQATALLTLGRDMVALG